MAAGGPDLRIVAIIPARGGSKGIPRKNARLLHGKPLVAHAIAAAQGSARISELYVSTDNLELAEIARSCGAAVLERPARLAADATTIDEVIAHEVRSLEEDGRPIDFVVTIQATSPLISASSIDAAIDLCVGTGCDTVVSVVEDTHLRWTRSADGAWTPLYAARRNRQQLPPTYRETGGVVVCARRTLATGSRFGRDVRAMEVPQHEAVDIDSRYDWWIAEKTLGRRVICFHVAGNQEIGTGHVHRALVLADRIIDHEVRFLVNDESPLALEMIRARHYPVASVAAGREAEAIVAMEPDLVVSDILDTSEEYMRPLVEAGIATVNFEDLGPGSELADCVINEMYDHHPRRGRAGTFNGVDYVCLRDEFARSVPAAPRREVENVLVLFGGTDPADLTLRVLPWLDELPGEWGITVLAGIGYGRQAELDRVARGCRHRVTVAGHAPVVSRVFEQADLAITSAGRTVFELASLAVPMVVLCQNEREATHSFARTSGGVAWLGPGIGVTRERFRDTLTGILGDPSRRRAMREALRAVDIASGVDRVLGIISGLLTKREKDGRA